MQIAALETIEVSHSCLCLRPVSFDPQDRLQSFQCWRRKGGGGTCTAIRWVCSLRKRGRGLVWVRDDCTPKMAATCFLPTSCTQDTKFAAMTAHSKRQPPASCPHPALRTPDFRDNCTLKMAAAASFLCPRPLHSGHQIQGGTRWTRCPSCALPSQAGPCALGSWDV